MKLAIPIDHLDPSRGGLERYVAEASAALARRGHEVHVPCVSATSIPDGVRVHELPVPPGPRSLRRFARACESWIERADLDVSLGVGRSLGSEIVQAHGGAHRSSREALTRAEPPGLRSVARRFGRALRWKDRFLERLEREQILHPSCRSVVVLSEIGRRQFLGVYPEVEDKIRVLPIGIDLDRFERGHRARSRTQIRRRWGIPDDRSIALFVGHHFRLKGLWPALEAIARIREDRRPHLLVCGRSAPPLSTVERLGLREFVTFAGAVAAIEPVLLGSDLLLQPTFYDPCSHVTLEAWAAGLPVVTTPWNGASELARGSPAVSIVDDPWDLDGLGRGIMEALDDETWKERSAAAREIAEGHSLERHMGELEDLLSEASSKVAKEGARAS